MFTGIIEEVGFLLAVRKTASSASVTIKAKKVLENISLGDSIAVNGVCLTVTGKKNDSFDADVMHETFKRTTFASLRINDALNLERAIPADGRLNGHLVTGHVDGTGKIVKKDKDGIAFVYHVRTSQDIAKYIITKGSVAVDGISLTAVDVSEEGFSVSVIPHTYGHTALSEKGIGDYVNVENDVFGKYVERFLRERKITERFLTENGF